MYRLFLLTSLFSIVLAGSIYPFRTDAGNVPAGETLRDQAYVTCGDLDEKPKDGIVDNPCGFLDIIKMAKGLITGWILAGVTFATLGFSYAGYLYITAMGSSEKISHAHSIFTKTALGFVFMLSAWLIAYTMENIFLSDDAKGRSFLQP